MKQHTNPSEQITNEAVVGPLKIDTKSLPTTDKDVIAEHKPADTVGDDTEKDATPEGEEPTEREKKTLRHVGESLPFSTFLVAFVELCERFTYYGCQGIFQVRIAWCD